MLLSAVSVLVVAQSSSEIPEGLMNNPVQQRWHFLTLMERADMCHIMTLPLHNTLQLI